VAIEPLLMGDPGPGELLVRMNACGVCHSDLYVSGLEKLPVLPITLGHEGVGRVEAIGSGVSGWTTGDRAGVTFMGTVCGECEWCLSGRERFCPRQTNFGYSLQGVLAEYAIVPAAAAVRVPEEVDPVQIAPMCCAGWTAYGALRESGLAAGETVALFGLGGLGHLALQMARLRGLRVAAVDLNPEKLEMARAAGAEFTAAAGNAGRALQKEWGGVHAAIVLTPSPSAIQQAFRALRRNGTLVLVGVGVTQYDLPLVDTVVKGVTIRGSYLGTRHELKEVFALAVSGAVRAHVQARALEETPHILESMRLGTLMGRAVIAF
jgi:alcohol dehydrogenase, propanol-preferring